MADIETLKADTFNFSEGSAPGTPASGQMVVYGDTAGRLWVKDDAGVPKLAAGFAGARVFNSAVQSITPSGTPNVVTFDSERFDTDAFHSTSVNTGRLTIPSGFDGKYLIVGHLGYATNATGYRDARIRLNGTTDIAIQRVGPHGDSQVLVVTAIYSLVATNYVELMANQTSGGALNTLASAAISPEFSITLLGS